MSFANKKLRDIGYKEISTPSESVLLISHVLTELSELDKIQTDSFTGKLLNVYLG